jgi:hypothetical protein
MSEQELYEIARQRVDQRRRRWTLWSIDLAGLIASLGIVALLADSVFVNLAVFLFFAWGGVFTLHTIVLATSESRDKDIEKEVAKLRAAVNYEKPKRLELDGDGELVEAEENGSLQRSRSE